MAKIYHSEAPGGRVCSVVSWASILDEGTIEQAKRLSRSYAVTGHVALMPDAHLGNGATVGSVFKTAASIIPAGVGVDIGCGVTAAKTAMTVSDFDYLDLRRIYGRICTLIPAGVGGAHKEPLSAWEQFERTCPLPERVGADPALYRRAATQFGTLGDGNHFVELSKDGENNVWIVIHSGSRGVGNLLSEESQTLARNQCESDGYNLEDPNLSWLVEGTTGFQTYIDHVTWAEAYAHSQRLAMLDLVLTALGNPVVEGLVSCHHNYTEKLEDNVWLTRKGAINAEQGRTGVIPGSMGAATYVVLGKGNLLAYNSAPHGAGRRFSRGEARRSLDEDEFKQQMAEVVWQDRDSAVLLDEAPSAYKNIDTVMADAAVLVEPVATLRQIANYKGTIRKKR